MREDERGDQAAQHRADRLGPLPAPLGHELRPGRAAAVGIRSRSGRSMRRAPRPSVVVRTSRLIVRCSSRSGPAMASSRIRMIRSGLSTIQ